MACVAAFMTGAAHGQVIAPYSVDFNGDSGALTTSTTPSGGGVSAIWSSPGGGGLLATFTGSGAGVSYMDASVQVTNLGTTASNFVESTDFSVTSNTPGNAGRGFLVFGALGDHTANFRPFGENSYSGYIVTFGTNVNNGDQEIDKYSGGAAIAGGNGFMSSPFVAGDLYHLTLTGTYDVSGDLTLSFTVTDTTNPFTSTVTTTTPVSSASALTGQFFGFEVGNTNDANSTVLFNNFSITTGDAVPEPSSYALLMLGGAALAFVSLRRTNRA